VEKILSEENIVSPENFCFWLNGYLELSGSKTLSGGQVNIIKEHLQLVFTPATQTATMSGEEIREFVKEAKDSFYKHEYELNKPKTGGLTTVSC